MITKELLRKNISENIKNERMARNLSIDELVNLMGIMPGFMGLIERGKRGATAYNLCKLASIFDIDIQRLITENNDYEKANENMNVRKKKKLASISSQLNDEELDLIINIIKNIDAFKNNK